MSETLAYVAAGVVFLWGVSHIIPTKSVVAGFGSIRGRSRRAWQTLEVPWRQFAREREVAPYQLLPAGRDRIGENYSS